MTQPPCRLLHLKPFGKQPTNPLLCLKHMAPKIALPRSLYIHQCNVMRLQGYGRYFLNECQLFFPSRDCIPHLKAQRKKMLFLCQLFPLIPTTNTEFNAERMTKKKSLKAPAQATYPLPNHKCFPNFQRTQCTTPDASQPRLLLLMQPLKSAALDKRFSFFS